MEAYEDAVVQRHAIFDLGSSASTEPGAVDVGLGGIEVLRPYLEGRSERIFSLGYVLPTHT